MGAAFENIGTTPGSSLGAASGALGFLGNIFGGFAQQGQLDVQAQIARNNAIIDRQNAAYAAQAGEAKTEQLGLRTRGQVAEISARQAGSGINPNTGSALDVRQSAGMLGNLDILSARSAAARQAYGYQQEASTEDLQAKMLRKAAGLAPIEGVVGGIGSLLGAASSLQGQYAQWQKEAGSGASPDMGSAGISGPGDFEAAFA